MPSKLTQSREYQLLNISATVYSLYRVTVDALIYSVF